MLSYRQIPTFQGNKQVKCIRCGISSVICTHNPTFPPLTENILKPWNRPFSCLPIPAGLEQVNFFTPSCGHHWPPSLLPPCIPEPVPHPVLFSTEDGVSMLLQNVSISVQDFTVSQPRWAQLWWHRNLSTLDPQHANELCSKAPFVSDIIL
jgi:hypothetical protein